MTQLVNSFTMWWQANEQAAMMAMPQMDSGGEGQVQGGAEAQQPVQPAV
jgi:hypothetical protein